MRDITEDKYKALKLRSMREWKNKLAAQGYDASDEELQEMWTVHDNYRIVEPETHEEIDWEAVRKSRSQTNTETVNQRVATRTGSRRMSRERKRKR